MSRMPIPSITREARRRAVTRRELEAELRTLRERLAEAEATLHAIGNDDVDALVVTSRDRGAPRVVMLEGAALPFRHFVESMRDGALTIAEDGTILHANGRLIEMVGRADVVGTRIDALFEDGGHLRALLQNTMRLPRQLDATLLHADGEATPVSISAAVLPLEGAPRVGVIVAAREATSGARQVAAGLAADRRAPASIPLDALLDQVPVGIILVDARSGGTTYANRHAERILGRTLNDTERPISTVDLTAWRPDGSIVEAERLLVSRALRGDCAVREDLARVREDGSTVQIRATAVPIHDDEGRAAAVVLALDDTTDEWLARTERDANERFRELFIGMLGHDLRSPLSSVVTGACVLRRAGDLNATQERTVERLERAGERMGRMVEQMLDFARSRLGGGIPVVCRPTSMHDLVRAIVAEVQPEQGPSRIDLELEGDGEGEWDPDRLGQVVANLVGNALTHGAQDGRVSVRVRGEPGSVTLQVHNDGPPIPENLLPVMFDPFRRAEVNGRGQGLGLGLYIAKQIVHAHGGALTVESSADAGTTFTVTLPRCVHRA